MSDERDAGLHLRLLSGLYGATVRLRSWGYDHGLLESFKVPGLKVVSVGSLRCGGMAKTPVAVFLARHLMGKGSAVAVVIRGYRGERELPGGLVSDGEQILLGPRQAGDEAVLLARSLPGVPVLCGADRVKQVRNAKALGADAVVLDDGFQHRRLGRDLDILLVHPDDLAGRSRLLPAGPLREPTSAMARARVLAGIRSDFERGGEGSRAPQNLVLFDLAPTRLIGFHAELALDVLRGQKVFLFAAVAAPERFRETVESLGATVAGHRWFRDHHAYSSRDVRGLASEARTAGADMTLTTAKDKVKMDEEGWEGPALHVLEIEARVTAGLEMLTPLLASLRSGGR